MDRNTYVIVELIKPEFSASDIYPEFRRLFCIDDYEGLFSHSPFLFMHRLRMVHVTHINESGEESFITEYKENPEKTVYAKPFELDKKKYLLAGIAKDGAYFHEQFQEGEITTLSENNVYFNVPIIRYTRMVEDDAAYRNYSIIAPVITADTDIDWQGGSLFRTFPMSLHPFQMPLAIDAPFILNPDRSGIQYSAYKDKEGQNIAASTWNTEVSERLFEKNGVYEAFFLWLRSIDGIRVDRYMKQEEIVLFKDRNNSDGHDNPWVPEIDIGRLCRGFPVFRLFANPERFVSYNEARVVNKNLFSWPCVKDFFRYTIGEKYESSILSDMYVGSNLFNAKPIVAIGFTDAMNAYLDVVESTLTLASAEMVSFFNNQLYPYLKDNAVLINKTELDAFKRMKIYLSRVKDGDSFAVVRESYSDQIKWFHTDNGKALLSINRYRIFESSPVDLSIIGKIVEGIFGKRTLFEDFGQKNQASTVENFLSWEEARDYIEAALYFGYELGSVKFACLKEYVLSKKISPEYNAFRETGILKTVKDEDILRLSSYFNNDLSATIKELIRVGIRTGRDFFVNEGSYLALSEDTVEVLKSKLCQPKVFKELSAARAELGKNIIAVCLFASNRAGISTSLYSKIMLSFLSLIVMQSSGLLSFLKEQSSTFCINS